MKRILKRLAALFALTLCLFIPGCGEGEYEEVEIGYMGPARYNPFLAAERFLKEAGCEVKSNGSFDQLPYASGTVVAPLQAFMNYGDANRVLTWVQNGGHLVLLLANGEPWRSDWKIWKWEEKETDQEDRDEEEKALLDKLGLKLDDNGSHGDTFVQVGVRTYRAELHGKFTLVKKPYRRDVDGGDQLTSFARGYGRVTLVADAHPFRNRYLAEQDHAALLHQLVSMDQRMIVSFVTGMKVSFWKMLWQHGWMVLVCLAVVLVLWLWKNLPRFGPILAAEDRSARDFTGHLALAGAFLWKYRQVPALLQPLQQEVLALLARRSLNPEDPATQEELATRCGLTADRVRQALFLVGPQSESVFLRTVQDLYTLRSKI